MEPSSAPPLTAAPQRVGFLDGLRGIAALLVVFCHSTAALFPAVVFGGSTGGLSRLLYATPILNLPFQGNFMVCVFYALSGLALSYHTLSRNDRSRAVSGLARRYPRLMVPVLGGILLAAGLLFLSLLPVGEAALLSGSKWWGKYWQFDPSLRSALYEGTVGVFKHAYSPYDPPLWTMHNEFLGSLLVFAVLLVSPRRWVRIVAYVILAWVTHRGYLLAFVGGMVICEAWMMRRDPPSKLGYAFIPLGFYGLLLGSYPIPSSTTPEFYGRIAPAMSGQTALQESVTSHVIGAILVVATVVALVPARRPLEWRPVLFLGRVSFALYILHFLVLGSIGAGLLVALDGSLPYAVNAGVVFTVVVIASIAFSWVFTRILDEPTVSLTGRAYRSVEKGLKALWANTSAKRRETAAARGLRSGDTVP
jgi:peptidoglycan/LPS O-acetylase OafA/YrhL